MTLDVAALDLATIEFPNLDARESLTILDSHAEELAGRLRGALDGAAYVREANKYLFDDIGFKGNAQDYYNPRNSCLNEVLTTRTGIPITLSVVYLEIGRRLQRPIFGIGLPGHFIVQYNDGSYCAYIDVFHGGRLLGPGQCIAVAREASGLDLKPDPRLLDPVGKQQILVRMIHNLRRAYLARGSAVKAIQVADLIVGLNPSSAEEHRNRAALHLQAHNMMAARNDFARYLALAPDAADRAEVEEQMRTIQHWLASLN